MLTNDVIKEQILPSMLEKRKMCGELNICHIVPTPLSNKNRSIFNYIGMLSDICKIFEIGYFYRNTNLSNVYTIYAPLTETIDTVNFSPNINGILFDFPFKYNPLSNLYTDRIIHSKDIEVLTSKSLGEYLTNINTNIIPPHQYVLNQIRRYHNMMDDFSNITIISNNFCSHKGLVPLYNFNYSKYTYSNIMNINGKCSADIIISMINTRLLESEYIEKNKIKLDAKIILDFSSDAFATSISKVNNTKVYYWNDSLMLLYILGCINNLITLNLKEK